MSAFADTSALYALLVRTDEAHAAVKKIFEKLADDEVVLWTTSFVVVETMALLQHRIGLAAARDFDEHVLPAIRIHWVDEPLYQAATDRLWREDRRDLSLVDCVSFEFMKREGIRTAMAVDQDFERAGFSVVP